MNKTIPNIADDPEYHGASKVESFYDMTNEIIDVSDLLGFDSSFNLSDDELYKKYAQIPKEKLLQMLISRDRQIDELMKQLLNKQSYYTNSVSKNYYDCSDWEHCSNPHRDCVNCPLHCVMYHVTGIPHVVEYDENNNYGNVTMCSETWDPTAIL